MKEGIIEFGKAQISSVISTVCDFLITAVAFELTRHVVGSTLSGALAGGVVNCVINYRWTFQGTKYSKQRVFWRYLLVWTGSVFLNTAGTEYGVKGVKAMGEMFDMNLSQTLSIVLVVKAVVAVTVAIGWNFFMQKYFVYRK